MAYGYGYYGPWAIGHGGNLRAQLCGSNHGAWAFGQDSPWEDLEVKPITALGWPRHRPSIPEHPTTHGL